MAGAKSIGSIGKDICDALGINAEETVRIRIVLDANELWAVVEQIVRTKQALSGEQEKKVASVLKGYRLVPIEEEAKHGPAS